MWIARLMVIAMAASAPAPFGRSDAASDATARPAGPATAPGGAASAAPAPRPASEIPVRLPADIMYRRAADSDTIVVFSHATHAAAAENRCVTCHPQTFHLLSRGPAPTHADMNAGRSCGICHDGHKTFAVADSGACQMCHVSQRARLAAAARAVDGATGAGGTAASRSVPAPHVYPRSADSPGAVTFKHATHRGLSGGCAACHPKLFKMAAEPPRPGGGMHESAACGSCHDGARTFATDDAASCARCHVEAGGSR